GPASSYGVIAVAFKAYISYINASRGPDKKRGVGGRQINFRYYDDGYNPATSIQNARQLVEQDKVFAVVGALGTNVNLAVRPYLNAQKVPQLFAATGATTFGRDTKQWPWTIGYQPSYSFEGKIYGTKIARNSPNAKIAVLYQNDNFGEDLLQGLEDGLGDKASNIVGKESYEVTAPDVKSQIAKLRATGASIFLIFATPKFAIQAYAIANALKWSPAVIYTTGVTATTVVLSLAQKAGGGDLVNRTLTYQYAKDPANPLWDNDEAMILYRKVLAKYAPALDPKNSFSLYGVATAHAFVQLLRKAGPNPTRAGLMKSVRSWSEKNPFLLPGNLQKTGPGDQFPISCVQIARFTDGTLSRVSQLQCDTPAR
ncbi:MAG: branched-chain amino acid ABC transporter substrate-binding protein, partial [Thermoleophilia bacterium]|nr:branched-chain amino acid ABC transporter substrate-binding protein [Thermoleophilia bacterium]